MAVKLMPAPPPGLSRKYAEASGVSFQLASFPELQRQCCKTALPTLVPSSAHHCVLEAKPDECWLSVCFTCVPSSELPGVFRIANLATFNVLFLR